MKFFFEVGEEKYEIQAPNVGAAMEYMNRNVMDKKGATNYAWFDEPNKKNAFYAGNYGVWD